MSAPLRVGVDGRELRDGVRTGIRRYVVEVVRAAVARGCPGAESENNTSKTMA